MNKFSKTLVLFFTSGGSLKRWDEIGNIERELYLYRQLVDKHGFEVHFITYGGNNDLKYEEKLFPIKVHSLAHDNKGKDDAVRIIAKNFSQIIKNADIIKTNQIKGANIALEIGNIFLKPVIVRCGYLPSRHPKLGDEKSIYNIEMQAFLDADASIVTTAEDKNYVFEKYKPSSEKVNIVPNYVITDVFKPVISNKIYDIIYIGRGSKEKNLETLINAIHCLERKDIRLKTLCIGACSEKKELKLKADKLGIDIAWIGAIDNFQLPKYLNSSKIFVLPSLYEGHPKALIEAMSCEMAVIGNKIEGIENLIIDGETGLFFENNVEDLSQNILMLLHNSLLRKKLGKEARDFVLKNFTFEKIIEKEIEVYKKVTPL